MADSDSKPTPELRETTAALTELFRTTWYLAEASQLLREKWLPEICAEGDSNLFDGLTQTMLQAANKQLDALEAIQEAQGIDSLNFDGLRTDQNSSIFQHCGGPFSVDSFQEAQGVKS